MSKKPRQHLLLLRRCYASTKTSTTLNRLLPPLPLSSLPKTLAPSRCQFCSDGTPDRIRDGIHLLTEKPTSLISDGDLDDIKARVSSIADEILTLEDVERVAGVLDARSVVDLLRRSPNGSASVELLSRLKAKPHFALEVRNFSDFSVLVGLKFNSWKNYFVFGIQEMYELLIFIVILS